MLPEEILRHEVFSFLDCLHDIFLVSKIFYRASTERVSIEKKIKRIKRTRTFMIFDRKFYLYGGEYKILNEYGRRVCISWSLSWKNHSGISRNRDILLVMEFGLIKCVRCITFHEMLMYETQIKNLPRGIHEKYSVMMIGSYKDNTYMIIEYGGVYYPLHVSQF